MSRALNAMVTVITGASAGIGRALAVELAKQGGQLALAARRADRLEALNQELGGGNLCVPTDVADPAACEVLIAAVEQRFGRIDTLVCNAGYGFLRPVAQTDAQAMTEIFRTNVLGTSECIRAALPGMRRPATSRWMARPSDDRLISRGPAARFPSLGHTAPPRRRSFPSPRRFASNYGPTALGSPASIPSGPTPSSGLPLPPAVTDAGPVASAAKCSSRPRR